MYTISFLGSGTMDLSAHRVVSNFRTAYALLVFSCFFWIVSTFFTTIFVHIPKENFMVFLQIWRHMVSRYPSDVPQKEKMDLFIDNLNDKMSYQLKIQCLPTFQKLIKNGIQVEEASIKKGTLKFSKEGFISSNNAYNNNYYNNSDKSKFWMRNKNVVNDGVVDNVKPKQPMLNLSDVTPPTNP